MITLKNKLNLLITGSSGFVGKYLVSMLTEQGAIFKCLTRNKIVNGKNQICLSDISEQNFDVVIHLAGRAHIINETAKNPLMEFRKANVDYTLLVAKHSYEAGVKRFIFISTVGVYGAYSTTEPLHETSKLQPQEHYAITKLEAERRLQSYCHEKEMELVILRPALIYGDNVPGNLKKLHDLCEGDIPLPFSDAKSARTMLNIHHFCTAILLCCTKSEASNEIYNVADSIGISTSVLIGCFKRNLNKKNNQFFVPKQLFKLFFKFFGKDKMYHQLFGGFVLDSSKLQKELNWEPCHDPIETLELIILKSFK